MTQGAYISRPDTGLAIYNAIKDSGYSQAQLAREMGVSPVVVSRWATGRHIPDMDSLARLADILGVDLNNLIIRKKHS